MGSSRTPRSASTSRWSDPQLILDIRTYKLVAGRRNEFDRIVREHSLPMLRRHGISVVAAGPSLQDDDYYVVIRSFTSLDERRQQLEEFYGSDEWLENYDAPVMELIEAYHTVVLPSDHDAADLL